MSLYPSSTVVPSSSLFPEVGEQIACFDDYDVTLEATYDADLELPAYVSTLTLPAYASSVTQPSYAATLTSAAYTTTLTATAYQTTLEATLDDDVTC